MADDIDDLLDEVESKYCKEKHSAKVKITKKTMVKKSGPRKEDDDLNALIDDIIDCPEPLIPVKRDSNHIPEKYTDSPSGSKATQKRCSSACLGGSAVATGSSSAMVQRACDKLRCTSCDFKVVFYDNYEWDSSCDYLFFRNNVPDFQRLCAKLKKRKGSRAYACQCSWLSVKSMTKVDQEDVKWVCGKHSS